MISFSGNVAYQKTASQPGSYAGLVASYAVDGQLGDQSHGNKFCAHPKNTENAAASWTVDLGDTYTVASVTIYNVHHQSGESVTSSLELWDDSFL